MNVHRIDPLKDRRWETLVGTHPDASIFHTTGWIEALNRTYGYEPVVYGTENDNRLTAGIPFCAVRSFITGQRLVSLPFSDHCQPLADNRDDLRELMSAAKDDSQRDRLKYVEIRPLASVDSLVAFETKFVETESAVVHKLDISRSCEELLHTFHQDCIRRKIARSERERLSYEEGRSEALLQKFYALLVLTRRRHGIPPQPLAWFRNLLDCLGDSVKICVASKDATPIASILTLSFKKAIVYKYSCSDPNYNALGGTIFLLWRTIQSAKAKGAEELDLGRSDYSTPGLIMFKDRWGAVQLPLNYYRSGAMPAHGKADSRLFAAGKRLLTTVPDSMFSALGGLLYRHVG